MLVAIIPLEADGVAANGSSFLRFGRGMKHGQRSRFGFGRLSDFSAALIALFIAERAGAGIAQPGKAVMALVAVFPLDIQAGSGSYVDLNRLGIIFCGRRRLQRHCHVFSIA